MRVHDVARRDVCRWIASCQGLAGAIDAGLLGRHQQLWLRLLPFYSVRNAFPMGRTTATMLPPHARKYCPTTATPTSTTATMLLPRLLQRLLLRPLLLPENCWAHQNAGTTSTVTTAATASQLLLPLLLPLLLRLQFVTTRLCYDCYPCDYCDCNYCHDRQNYCPYMHVRQILPFLTCHPWEEGEDTEAKERSKVASTVVRYSATSG
jgi:hypothetical protein